MGQASTIAGLSHMGFAELGEEAGEEGVVPCGAHALCFHGLLDLLRFFLNHRRFLRSRHAERQGKSPRELMTGQGHPHWLTLLGLGPLQPQQA